MNSLGMYCGYCQREFVRDLRIRKFARWLNQLAQTVSDTMTSYRLALATLFTSLAVGGLILAEVYVFLVQLAEFGWH